MGFDGAPYVNFEWQYDSFQQRTSRRYVWLGLYEAGNAKNRFANQYSTGPCGPVTRHECIANHHRDPSSISGFTSSHQYNIHIPLWPLNKQYLREVGSSATCCWQWVRLLIRIMPNHQFMLSTHHSHSWHYDSTLIDKIILFETNFVSILAILQHIFSFWQ